MRAGTPAMADRTLAVLVAVHAAAALLAGCAQPGAPDGSAPGPAPTTEGPLALVLDGCVAWQAPMLFPGNTGPGEPPRGWAPAGPGTLHTGVGMSGFLCDRVSVGPFERGPVGI